MPVIQSTVDTHSDSYQANREGMLATVDALREVEARVRATELSKTERFRRREQLMPRDRVNLMLDRGSPFLELQTLNGYLCHDDKDGSLAGGNTICGIGYVAGVRCMIIASNSAIKGGTMTPWGVQKTLRMQEICRKQKLPLIS